MKVLLDNIVVKGKSSVFAIHHLEDKSFSVVIPDDKFDFNYLGMNKSCFSIPIGCSEEITDDEGDTHIITRLS